MKTDIQIAQEAQMQPIKDVAALYDITEDDLELYGKYKAKFTDDLIQRVEKNEDGKLVLVTAINPTPAGEGKTTTSIGLAQAMVGDPKILILDEPTVGLDPKQIIEVRDLIKNLAKEHTILLSSHILQEVQAVCDKLIIINHGRIVAIDTPENLSRNILQINKLELRVKGPKNEILRGIQEIEGVENAELLRVREEGTVDIKVETDETTDVREAIFEFCSEMGFPILMMKTDEINLEDIFLQVTGEREAKR